MPPSTRKRGHGGGDHGDASLLGAVGLGDFARLRLPDPPDGLEVAAAYDRASGRIAVSVRGEGVSATEADLAAALALPPGAVGLPVGLPADFLSSAEAIAAVRRFVRDRVLLGDEEESGTESEEVAAAFRLVEEGKAYEVDWAGLVWAVLKGEVVAGTPRRYVPYLLRLFEYHRPEPFAEMDERLPLPKRWKSRTLQPGQWTGENLGISEEREVEEDKEEIALDYTLSQDIGDLEEMPLFGEVRDVSLAVPVDCKGTFLEQEEAHGVHQGHVELRSQSCSSSDVKLLDSDTECDGEGIPHSYGNNQISACNSSFGRQFRSMDEQGGSSSAQRFISRPKSQLSSSLQRIIENDGEDDNSDDLDVGIGSAVIRNVPLEISPHPVLQHGQSLQSFNGCLQQILVGALCMEKGYLDKEKDRTQLEAEVQFLKKMVMERKHIIEATKCDILKELRANETKMYQFEKAREVMVRSVQQYKELVKKSSAEFQMYKNMMQRGKGVDSCSGVSGITYEQKLMQQLHAYCLWIQSSWSSASLKLDEKVKQMLKDMANIDCEVKRLKGSISIPDLNNGTGDDGEDQTSPCKSEDGAWEDEGDFDSSAEQKGKHRGGTIANPDHIGNIDGSMDMNRVRGCSGDEACHVGASQGSILRQKKTLCSLHSG